MIEMNLKQTFHQNKPNMDLMKKALLPVPREWKLMSQRISRLLRRNIDQSEGGRVFGRVEGMVSAEPSFIQKISLNLKFRN